MTSIFFAIEEEAFIERFRPVPNHLDDNASFDFGDGGCIFETYGPELDYVRLQPEEHIWTVLDVDGELMIASGYHFVNRLGYILTAKPWPERTLIEVSLSDDASPPVSSP